MGAFARRSSASEARGSWCKECCNQRTREWRQNEAVKAKEREASKAYRKTARYRELRLDPDRREHRRALIALRRGYKTRKPLLNLTAEERKRRELETFRKANAKRRATSEGKLNGRISARIWQCLRAKDVRSGGRAWECLVGYDLAELRVHIERQFAKGMTWANMGEWHIDHIIPLASFSFSGTEDPEFKAAWALTNLRPLWAADNIRKRDKLVSLI